MNRIYPILFFLFFGLALTGFAQDKIHLKNGNVVSINIVGSDAEHILGKSTNPADRQVYKYPKSEIHYLEYQGGRTEYFDEHIAEDDTLKEKFVEEEELPEPLNDHLDMPIKKTNKNRMFYVGGFGGLNFPILEYGKAGGYNHGYAKTGGYFNLESSVLFNSFFGMGLTMGGSWNKMKETAFERKWELPDLPSYDGSLGSYQNYYIMIGPYFSIRAEKRLFLDIKIRYGFSVTPEPSYKLRYADTNDLGQPVTRVINNNDSSGFQQVIVSPLSLGLGAMLRYNVTDRLGIALQLDWMFLPYFFESQQNISTYDANGRLENFETRTIDITEIISMNYVGLGIYFNILVPD